MYTKIMFAPLLIVLVVISSSKVYGHGSGAPVSACDTMMVHHHDDDDVPFNPQNGPTNYTLTTDVTKVDEGGKITVTFQSKEGSNFKGLLLKAIPSNNGLPGPLHKACGSFQIDDPLWQTQNCSDLTDSAITHTTPDEKTSVKATWIAPQLNSTTTFIFVAAIVETKDTFWNAYSFPLEVTVTVKSGQATLNVNYLTFIFAIIAIVTRF